MILSSDVLVWQVGRLRVHVPGLVSWAHNYAPLGIGNLLELGPNHAQAQISLFYCTAIFKVTYNKNMYISLVFNL